MSRRVHFAPTNVLYSPIPIAPSPTLTETSFPSSSSSDAPITPPPVLGGTPVVYTHAPFQYSDDDLSITTPHHAEERSTGMCIHRLLAYQPDTPAGAMYDLWSQPAVLEHQFPRHTLAEPATQPPLPSILIICPLLPWNISIEPSQPHLPNAFVSVQDVFNGIYRALRLPVHPDEYNREPLEVIRGIDTSYFDRCARIIDPGMRFLEQEKGIKRVDFLLGRIQFLGLMGTTKGDQVWELNVI